MLPSKLNSHLFFIPFRPGVIVGLGNPLLDVVAPVTNDYLVKWNLKPNDAILADEKHKELPEEVKKLFPVKFTGNYNQLSNQFK